jgi:hypothetical protein
MAREKESVHCAICGHTLKHPDSIAAGMGPVCRGVPNRVRKRFTREFTLCDVTCRLHPEDVASILSFFKIYSVCAACRCFRIPEREGAQLTPEDRATPEYARYQQAVERFFRGMGEEDAGLAVVGRCTAFGCKVDGNLVLKCPEMRKQSIHRLRDEDTIVAYSTAGERHEFTGRQVIDWRRERAARRRASGAYT